jgi:hypothetical protein
VLDVEEGGPDKRSITSLDSATSITTDMSCFKTSDGKEDCYFDSLPGECDVVNSFASDGHRHLQEGPTLTLTLTTSSISLHLINTMNLTNPVRQLATDINAAPICDSNDIVSENAKNCVHTCAHNNMHMHLP